MNAIDCIKGRRSVRKFKDDPIPHEVMDRIVETASYSPSWKNSQVPRYMVIEDKAVIDKLGSECVLGFEYNTNTLKNAHTLVLINAVTKRSGYEKDGSYTTSKEDRWEMFDAGIASQTFCLAAYEEGLGTVIMGIFDEDKVGKVVDIPEGQRFIAVIAIGYPDEDPKMPRRKPVEELVTYL
ncbi:MAG: nitroreductase family protein [Eubacteriaceae bacterium]|nr:nitroreductase family protein [Eubacteriaceae bacterium]